MKPSVALLCLLFFIQVCSGQVSQARSANDLAVIAYYSGDAATIETFDVTKLTHIIFSFCHLQGERMAVSNARDSATIHWRSVRANRNC